MPDLVLGRAIAEHVGDQTAIAINPGRGQSSIEQLPGLADEWPSQLDLVGARGLADQGEEGWLAVFWMLVIGEGQIVGH